MSKVASGEATAESVRFLHNGNEHRAFVKNEVIVSAGYANVCHVTCSLTRIAIWEF